MSKEEKSFWSTFPGLLSGIAAIIAAIATLIGALFAAGVIARPTPTPPATPAPPTSAPKPATPASSTSAGLRDEVYGRLAKAQWEALAALQRNDPSALAQLDTNLRDTDEAIKAFPDDARFHMLKGYTLKDIYQSPASKTLLSGEQRREYLSRARTATEEALQLDANSAGAHNLMGNILYFEGNCDAAIAEYDTALRVNLDANYRAVIEGDKQLAVQARASNSCPPK